MCFEDGGWGHEPREARGLEKLKKTTERELSDDKFVLFQAIEFTAIHYKSNGKFVLACAIAEAG